MSMIHMLKEEFYCIECTHRCNGFDMVWHYINSHPEMYFHVHKNTNPKTRLTVFKILEKVYASGIIELS